MYNYAILDPRDTSKTPAALETNNQVFANAGIGVFGIEITVPTLVERCNLGNLDPQHSGSQSDIAACVAALSIPLPPDGATLATVRPDADSVLAMAVLTARLVGLEDWDMSRILLVGQGDCAPNGPWIRDYSPPAEFAQVNAVAMNFKIPLNDRVLALVGWIMGTVRLPERTPTDRSSIDVALSECGRYAIARADGVAGKGACGAGYQIAPIVVALNEAFSMRGEDPYRKYTIARWNATHVPMNWTEMIKELNEIESGWGGTTSICGSPQGTSSILTLDQVREIMEKHLLPA